MFRSTTVGAAFVAAAAFISPASAAVLDVTGYWKTTTGSPLYLDVERQFNTFKVAILEGKSGGFEISFAESPDQKGNGFATTAYVIGNSVQGLRRRGTAKTNVGPVQVAFTDSGHGTLTWKGGTYSIVRDEFVASGLAAPIDPSGPETGWYVEKNGGVAFVENQGAMTKVTQYAPNGARRLANVAIVAKASVPSTNGLAGLTLNGTSYTRDDFEDPTTPVPFSGDQSAYSIPSATETQIVKLPGAASMRLRAAARERTAAYFAYFASPTPDQAVATTNRGLTAQQCVRDITPLSLYSIRTSLDRIIFDSLAKGNLFLQLQGQLGVSIVKEQNVSASAPNGCALFMQGLARQFSQNGAMSAAKTYQRPAPPSLEQRQAQSDLQLKRSRTAARPSNPAAPTGTSTTFGSLQTCNRDEYVFLSGVGTGAEAAEGQADEIKKSIAQSLNVPISSVLVTSIANPVADPLKIFNIAQVLLNRFGVSSTDVALFEVESLSFFTGQGNITGAVLSFILSEYAQAAIVTDAYASSVIQNSVSSDVAAGYRTLLIPHSQGNIQTNGGIERLDAETLSHVGLTPVASADNHVPGNGSLGVSTSLTRDDDNVINTLRFFKSDTLPGLITKAKTSRDTFWQHLILEDYFYSPVARSAILDGIRVAMTKAKFPSTDLTLGVDAGGFTGPSGQQRSFNIGRDVTEIDVNYNMYTIPDAMDVLFRGKRVASTGGPVSYTGTLHAQLPIAANDHSAETLDVIVYGTDPGTAWNYAVQCPMPKS